jgi:hypothetical protein
MLFIEYRHNTVEEKECLMKIVEMLSSRTLLAKLMNEKGLSAKAKFQLLRNIELIHESAVAYDAQQKDLIELHGIKLEAVDGNPDVSRLVFPDETVQEIFNMAHEPLLNVDVVLPHSISALDLLPFMSVADLMGLGNFVDLSTLES